MSEISILNGYKIKDKKAVRYYDSISNMKSDTTLKAGMHVKTKGYHTSNDGGHGEYVIVDDETLVDDGGSIHTLSNGLRAVLIIDDMVNIKQFGAKGDNETDDSNAFNTILNTIDNIFIPEGTYLINNSINISKSNINLYGKATINFNLESPGFIFTNVNNINIRDLKITAPNEYNLIDYDDRQHIMIKFTDSNNIDIHNCEIYQGVMGVTFSNCSKIEFYNNILHDFKSWGLYFGSGLTPISYCNIYNNVTYNGGYDGIKLTGYIENINVYDNTCYDNSSDGIDFAGHTAKNINIYNNSIFNNHLNGIDFKQLTREEYPIDDTKTKVFSDINIYNNNIRYNEEHGINSQLYYDDVNINNFNILNNNITFKTRTLNGYGTGIRIAPCVANTERAILIKNNDINGNNKFYYGIRLSNCKNIVVESNNIYNSFTHCIYIDYNETLVEVLSNITINNNKCYVLSNNDVEVISTTNADNMTNFNITNNDLYNNGSRYLIKALFYKSTINIFGNTYRDSFDSIPSSFRTSKNVIYKSSSPIDTECVGWIGKSNGIGQLAIYNPITLT